MIKNIIEQAGLRMHSFNKGEVWLVGAGPGDPGLLTLHALNAITKADYILYDALVDQSCLRLARDEAVLEFAGKRPGQPSPKQHEITARLIELARDNKKVLRLKGGDPFIFGRGGEEALSLARALIPFRIIPGITAAIAAPAYVGIPITSRQINQSLSFITGHDASGAVPELDWQALARGAAVLVFYMAMKHIGEICQKLMAAGRAADEPVAFITKATTPHQTTTFTTLIQAEQTVRIEKITSPTIVIIGKAVNLAQEITPLPFYGIEQFPKSVQRLRIKNCGEKQTIETQISDSIKSHSALDES